MTQRQIRTKQDARDRLAELKHDLDHEKYWLQEVTNDRRQVLREVGQRRYDHLQSVGGLPGDPDAHYRRISEINRSISEIQDLMWRLPE